MSGCVEIVARCSCCGKKETYSMSEAESRVYLEYLKYGRELGYIQDLFPDVPAWIRSGGIDQYSNGFCMRLITVWLTWGQSSF